MMKTKLDLTNWDVEQGTQFLDLAARHTTLIVEDGVIYMIRESVDFGIDNLKRRMTHDHQR